MQCPEFKTRLDWILDHRESPRHDAKLRAHARQCSNCADWLDAHDMLLAGFQQAQFPRPVADFSLRVLGTVEAQRVQRKRWRVLAVACLSVAAALLVIVLSWRSSDAPPVAQEPNVRAPVRPLVAMDYEQFAQRTMNLTTKQLVLMGKVAEGFKPVTSSVYTALNSLLRSLPGSELANVLL
jgi:predicted anti-sigma-YlaC factor YlaD